MILDPNDADGKRHAMLDCPELEKNRFVFSKYRFLEESNIK